MVQTAKRERARKQPAEQRRETVLDAAVRVFARTPYRSAGTAEIAREAGVAEPTIYRHFESKRELYLAAVERTSSSITEEWRRIVARIPDARQALKELGHWYTRMIASNPDTLRLRMRAKAEAEDDEVRGLLRRGYAEIHRIAADVIRLGQEQGAFSTAVDADGAAWLYLGIGQMLDLGALTGLIAPEDPGCTGMIDTWQQALLPALS